MSTRGERLTQMRKDLNLRQSEVAERIGVKKQTLYKYEHDIVETIPQDKLEALASVYGVSPGAIVGWDRKDNQILIEVESKDALLIGMRRRCREIYAVCEQYLHASQERRNIVKDVLGIKEE